MFRFIMVLAAYVACTCMATAATAEQALRARAQQFFQLQVEKKFRQAEALVAQDSKDDYYNNGKYNIKSSLVQKVELLDHNSRAKVTIKAKVTLLMPEAGPMDFDAPLTSLWKIEHGKWFLYIDSAAAHQTPFGTLKPSTGGGSATPFQRPPADMTTLRNPITIDQSDVVLRNGAPATTLTITNNLPGGVDLEVKSDPMPNFSWELEKKHLDAGQKAWIRLRASDAEEGKGTLHLLVSPMGAQIDVRFTIN